jgi:hypothetical protein
MLAVPAFNGRDMPIVCQPLGPRNVCVLEPDGGRPKSVVDRDFQLWLDTRATRSTGEHEITAVCHTRQEYGQFSLWATR